MAASFLQQGRLTEDWGRHLWDRPPFTPQSSKVTARLCGPGRADSAPAARLPTCASLQSPSRAEQPTRHGAPISLCVKLQFPRHAAQDLSQLSDCNAQPRLTFSWAGNVQMEAENTHCTLGWIVIDEKNLEKWRSDFFVLRYQCHTTHFSVFFISSLCASNLADFLPFSLVLSAILRATYFRKKWKIMQCDTNTQRQKKNSTPFSGKLFCQWRSTSDQLIRQVEIVI